jgi:hypothetical protein
VRVDGSGTWVGPPDGTYAADRHAGGTGNSMYPWGVLPGNSILPSGGPDGPKHGMGNWGGAWEWLPMAVRK